jgi:hypothetical protein
MTIKIDPTKVLAVYSGKPGCMCGCNGKYTYNPEHRALAGVDRGYEVGEDECSAKGVLTLSRKIERLINEEGWEPSPDSGDRYLYIEDRTGPNSRRCYAIYWAPEAALSVFRAAASQGSQGSAYEALRGGWRRSQAIHQSRVTPGAL